MNEVVGFVMRCLGLFVSLLVAALCACDSQRPAPSNLGLDKTDKTDMADQGLVKSLKTSDGLRRVKQNVDHPRVDRYSPQELIAWQLERAGKLGFTPIFTATDLNIRLAFIPQGSFLYGDQSGFGDADEQPAGLAVIDDDFAMMQYEVSYRLWNLCVAAKRCAATRGVNESAPDNIPVANINLIAIQQQFIPWLYDSTGLRWQLPSEKEWEYAARAGSVADYPWGSTASHDYANYGAQLCCSARKFLGDKWLEEAPVGSFSPNHWGLHDMIGNVSEWTNSCYSSSLTDNASSDCQSALFVTKGGSWYHPPSDIRVSNRSPYSADSDLIYLGFRLIVKKSELDKL